jgi:hypothetical protein
MRKVFLAVSAAGAIATLNASASMAMPAIGNVVSGPSERPTQAGFYCYNRWGCWHGRWGYGWHRPYAYYGWHRPYYGYGWQAPYPYYSWRKQYWYKGR